MTKPSIPKTLAGVKILQALEQIEQAQRSLARAAEDLSDVEGLSPEWNSVMKASDQAHKVWTKVKAKFDHGKFDMAAIRATPPPPAPGETSGPWGSSHPSGAP
ncbi:MAG: hypothetical protein L0170_03620 [Acidobacteria bacterium]|nr:hypothetical protein [Acidobacteriota bacterium]